MLLLESVLKLRHEKEYYAGIFLFFSLTELVKEGENGCMFENSEQLAGQLKTWFENFPNNSEQNKVITKFRNNLKTFQKLQWDSNWNNRAKPIFT